MQGANDNSGRKTQSIFECLKGQHDGGVPAEEVLAELIMALAVCTVTWGCDVNEVCTLYRDFVVKKRGR